MSPRDAGKEFLAYYKSEGGRQQLYDLVVRSYTDVGERIPFEAADVRKELDDWGKAFAAAGVLPEDLDELYTAELIAHSEKRRISVVDILKQFRLRQAQQRPEPTLAPQNDGDWNGPPPEVALLFRRFASGKGQVSCHCRHEGRPVPATLIQEPNGELYWVCSSNECNFEIEALQLDSHG